MSVACVVALAGLVVTFGQAQAGPSLKLVATTTTGKLPIVRKDFPFPDEPRQVFFIQRSMNANTVIYAVKETASGEIDTKNPLTAYWRRYNNDGEIAQLGFFEDLLAYGVSADPLERENSYRVKFKALPQFSVTLRRSADGSPALFSPMGGKQIRIVYAWLELDESGILPEVVGLRLFGIDPDTGNNVETAYKVSGAEVSQ